MADFVIRLTLPDDTDLERAGADATSSLAGVPGVQEVEIDRVAPESERLDISTVAEGLAAVTMLLGTARLTVDAAGSLLESVRDLATKWKGVEDAIVELPDGSSVPLSSATPHQLADASA